MQFASKIRIMRGKHGVDRLAHNLGVSPRTIEGWQQGRPASSSVARLVNLLWEKKIKILEVPAPQQEVSDVAA